MEPITCPSCGYVTLVSWRRRRREPRFCRRCGARIAEPVEAPRP